MVKEIILRILAAVLTCIAVIILRAEPVFAGEEVVAFTNDHACSWNAPYISCYEWTDAEGVQSTGTKYASDLKEEEKEGMGHFAVKFLDSTGNSAVTGDFDYGARIYVFDEYGNKRAEYAVRQDSVIELPAVMKILQDKELDKWSIKYVQDDTAFHVEPIYKLLPTPEPTPTPEPEEEVKKNRFSLSEWYEMNKDFMKENCMTHWAVFCADGLSLLILMIRLLFMKNIMFEDGE